MTTIRRPLIPRYMRRALGRALDALLGPRCRSCGQRTFPKDALRHRWLDHAGDDAYGGAL